MGLLCWVILFAVIYGILYTPEGKKTLSETVSTTKSSLRSVYSKKKILSYGDVYDMIYFSPYQDSNTQPYCNSLNNRYIETIKLNNKKVDESIGESLNKYKSVKKLLDKYIHDHNRNKLFPYDPEIEIIEDDLNLTEKQINHKKKQDEALCQSNHSFLLGVYSCPHQIGNRMHEFLNAFAAAVITNRTLIWKFCDRQGCDNKADDCQSLMQLNTLDMHGIPTVKTIKTVTDTETKPDTDTDGNDAPLRVSTMPWIIEASTLLKRLRNGGCEYPTYIPSNIHGETETISIESEANPWNYLDTTKNPLPKTSGGTHIPDSSRIFANGVVPHQIVPHSLYSTNSETVIACCGIDTLKNHRILDIGSLERREIFGLSMAGANLGPRGYARANALFSGGSSFAYGMLLRNSFHFGLEVKDWNAITKTMFGIIPRQQRRKLQRINEIRHRKKNRINRRNLSKDPIPDDDGLDATTARDDSKDKNKAHSGRQELPPEALALNPNRGETVIKSPQGTSVGPKAAGKGVIITDAVGKEAEEAALRAGAAPKDTTKKEKSPNIPLSDVQKKHLNDKANNTPKTRAPKDRWADPTAGNFTAQAHLSEQASAQNGIGTVKSYDSGMKVITKNIGSGAHADVMAAVENAVPYRQEDMKSTAVRAQNPPRKPNEIIKSQRDAVGKLKPDIKPRSTFRKRKPRIGSLTSFILGVHLRHMSSADIGEKDRRGELNCIKRMLNKHVPDFQRWQEQSEELKEARKIATAKDIEATDQIRIAGEFVDPDLVEKLHKEKSDRLSSIKTMEMVHQPLDCLVLLASDRSATLTRLRRDIRSLGCAVQTAPRNIEESQNPVIQSAHDTPIDSLLTTVISAINEHDEKVTRKHVHEHGPYKDGILPIADLEFLSHADAFIGSADDRGVDKMKPSYVSTFSLLIASLISTNERNRNRLESNPDYNILTKEDDFICFLPSCDGNFGSYRVNPIPNIHPSETDSLNSFYDSSTNPYALYGSGNGHYETTDCSFFTWNRQCMKNKIMESSQVCSKK